MPGEIMSRQTYDDGGGSSRASTIKPSKDYEDRTKKMIDNYRAGLYRGGYNKGSSDTGSSGYNPPSYDSNYEDIISKIKNYLNEQKQQADAYYKTLYEQQLTGSKEDWENNRNQINRDYRREKRYLNNLYGNELSGAGLSNRTRSYQNWNNNLTANQKNYINNKASALASYQNNLANTAQTLAQGWYNYVLPVYTNRQQNLDDYDYRYRLFESGML